jgi:hypothetical protein
MFLSKIQVKNLLTKELGKHNISQERRGRICSYSSTGLKFDEKENGFIRVRYFDSNATYHNREATKMREAQAIEKANAVLIGAGFEFDKLDGYRKARNAKGKK